MPARNDRSKERAEPLLPHSSILSFALFERILPRGGEVLAGSPRRLVQTRVRAASINLAVLLACREGSHVPFRPADNRKRLFQLSCFLLLP